MNLFAFYKLSFIVAALSASSLSIIGKHYLSRGTILEIFFLSQMSLFGNLLSKLFFHAHESTFLSLISSYSLFGFGAYILHRLKLNKTEKGTFMVGGYLFLLALQYLLIGYFPQLDSHMSVGFFGNMVTASSSENLLMIVILLVFLAAYFIEKKSVNRNTIEINILNSSIKSKFELLLFSVPLIASLFGLGFLYTMSFLLLPSLVIGKILPTEKSATLSIALLSLICSVLGLALSVSFERLSTSSLQISILAILLFAFCLIQKIRLHQSKC